MGVGMGYGSHIHWEKGRSGIDLVCPCSMMNEF